MILTKESIENIPIPGSGQKLYYDNLIKGFGIRVTYTGRKCYFVQKRVGYKIHRKTIAYIDELSLEKARMEANKIFGLIAIGKNPFMENKYSKEDTVLKIFEKYLTVKKKLKESTIYQYNRIIKIHLKNWNNIPLQSINIKMIIDKHEYIAENYSKSIANSAIILIGALFTFEKMLNPSKDIVNPVKFFSSVKGWYHLKIRKNYIKKDQLKLWHNSLMKCESKSRDYLLFLLFTGLRRQEAAKLRWENVDFHSKTISIIQTKNGDMHELPLNNYLYSFLFNKDKEGDNPYVFPGARKTGHIQDAKKAIIKIKEETGIKFMIHDLRRTFATIADSLDISSYAIKKLLNHRQNGDVTAGYIGIDIERLRDAMEKIGGFIVEQFEI